MCLQGFDNAQTKVLGIHVPQFTLQRRDSFEEHGAKTAGHIKETVAEINLFLALLDPRGGHGIVLVVYQVVHDELVKESVHDLWHNEGKVFGILGVEIDAVGVRCLCRTFDK